MLQRPRFEIASTNCCTLCGLKDSASDLDKAVSGFTSQFPAYLKYVIAVLGAAFVVLLGRYFAGKSLRKSAAEQLEHLGASHDHPSSNTSSKDQAR